MAAPTAEYREISPTAWRTLIRDFLESGPPATGGADRQAALIRLVSSPNPALHHSFEVNAQDLIE